MEIFFAYNIGMAIFAVIFMAAALIVHGARGRMHRGEPELYWHWPKMTRTRMSFTAFAWALIVGWTAWCIHDNYGYRETQRPREEILARFSDIMHEVVKRPFSLRCAFNGQTVAADWIKTDSFPCVQMGDIRIWKKTNGGDFDFGRIDGTDVAPLFVFYSFRTTFGYFRSNLPIISLSPDDETLSKIVNTLSAAL